MPSRKVILQEQLNKIQSKLDILNRVPEDTYPFGTIIRFAANGNAVKWHIMKIDEESWIKIGPGFNSSTTVAQSTGDWILEAVDSNIGYFEVYVLTVGNAPIYTSE
jgi:hypothetical protein